MSESLEFQIELEPTLRAGDLDTCSKRVIEVLRKIPTSPFHIVIDLDFTNPLKQIAGYFSEFIEAESEHLKIKAVYTEMMGFYINTDVWGFDPFAYSIYGGHDDYDWLSDWDSDDFREMVLTGMEKLQRAYEPFVLKDLGSYSDAKAFSDLLVVIKFQKLISKAAPLIKGLKFPLLASAHDYDFIYEFRK
jgi:hypothetical protein